MSEFAITIGTRPELIKMAPVIREIRSRGYDPLTIYTGQHNLESLSNSLNLPEPDVLLDTPPESAGKFSGSLVNGITKASHWTLKTAKNIRDVCKKENVDSLLFQGDTLAIASASIGGNLIKDGPVLGHVEAGIRTHDIFDPFPEEISRKIADKTSDLLFAPTEGAVENLEQERIRGDIHLTGNTIVDAVHQHEKLSKDVDIDIPDNDYGVCFVHRQENVHSNKNIDKFHKLLSNIEDDVVLIEHPTLMNQINGKKEKFEELGNIHFKDLKDYLSFLNLTKNSKYVITDSGGIQEESTILNYPCIVWRNKTERPEAVQAGTAKLVGNNWKKAIDHIEDYKQQGEFYKEVKNANNPFGDGDASKRIVDAVEDEIGSR